MANIPNYDPGSAPNLAVGSPGINNAPGQALRSDAADMGQTRDELAKDRMTRINSVLDPFRQQAPYIGAALGQRHLDKQKKLIEDENKQTAAHAESQIADKAFQFAKTADKLTNHLKNSLLETPELAPGQSGEILDDEATKYVDEIKSNPEFGKDPTIANRLDEKLKAISLAQTKELNDWSRTQLDSNAKAVIKNGSEQAVDSVKNATGSRVEKYEAYKSAAKTYVQLTDNKARVLGKDAMDITAHDTILKAGVALFDNYLADAPSDPKDRLAHYHDVREFLDEGKVKLPEGAQKQLQGTIEAHSEHAAKLLINQLSVKEDEHDEAIFNVLQDLKAKRYNPQAMSDARTFAKQQTDSIRVQEQQVNADPTLPPEVKHAYHGMFKAQLIHVGQITASQEHQQDHMDSVAATAANKAVAAANREAAKATHESNQLAAQQRNDELKAINNSLIPIMGMDPQTQGPEIQKGFQAAGRAAIIAGNKTAANGKPLMSAAKTFSIVRTSFAGAKSAADHQNVAPNAVQQFFHTIIPGLQMPSKPMPQAQRQQEQAKAAKGISDSIATLQNMHKWDQSNIQAGFSHAQHNAFGTAEVTLRQKAKDNNWTPQQLDFKMQQLQASIMQTVPK